jgi:putative glutamine amidotransferase
MNNSDVVVATVNFKYSFEQAFNSSINVIGKWDYTEGRCSFDLESLEKSKLVIFTGGEDINPILYNQQNRYSSYNPERDYLEKRIFEQALEWNKKLLGVCRGHQLINALLGGSLVQDIERELKQNHSGHHDFDILENHSEVVKLFPDGVNSMHHQGVIKAGDGLVPTTFHNGVYESCESDNIITVQFHPEFMGSYSNNFFNFIKFWFRS